MKRIIIKSMNWVNLDLFIGKEKQQQHGLVQKDGRLVMRKG